MVVIERLRKFIWNIFHSFTYPIKQHNNSSPSIVCNMCLGGILSHERGWQFRSPFVNLMIPADEFVELIQNLQTNINLDISDISDNSKYPIGLLGGKFHLHFIHYRTFQEAVEKWRERSKRIDYNNIYIILVQTKSCSTKGLINFQSLPFKKRLL